MEGQNFEVIWLWEVWGRGSGRGQGSGLQAEASLGEVGAWDLLSLSFNSFSSSEMFPSGLFLMEENPETVLISIDRRKKIITFHGLELYSAGKRVI